MDSLRIHLLGSPHITQQNEPIIIQRRKTLALLAYLFVTAQPQNREALATLFWPDYDQAGARANLRRDLSRLREALGDAPLIISRAEVRCNPDSPVWLDTAVFMAHLTAVRQHSHPPAHLCPECLNALTAAVTLYKGDFMTGFSLPDSPEFDRWQFFQAETWRHGLAEALQQLIQWHSGQGEFELGLAYARRWLSLDALHEPAQRQLMQLYAWSGQSAAALRQYQECVHLLQTELGIHPEAETTALYEAIRTRQLTPPPGLIRQQISIAAAPPAERYQLQEKLAVGGHGELFRGLDRTTGQIVVIKRIRPELVSSNPEYMARFQREGQILSELNHPNIVTMLSHFELDGQHHIVMEYIPDGSLRHLLERQPQLPLPQALTIALELADALSRAHHRQIIHRDIKPENVLLAADGSPRLTDFGLARLRHDNSLITQTGLFIGSPAYMSPEALRGEPLDARADIWSFAILLYEMLAGRRPFTGEQITPVMVRILSEPVPDIRQFRPDVPPALAELLQRMLDKEPDKRIGSMRLVAAALEAIRDLHPATPIPYALSSSPVTINTLSFPPVVPLPTPPPQQIRYSISADGVRIAYAVVGSGPIFVKAANWLSHLEFDWESPVWRHWLTALSAQHTLVRYDERGCGLSDWDVSELSVDAFVRDLEGVVETLGLERFPLLGISQGGPVALSYAVRHPEKVSHLILYGTYSAGRFHRTYSPEQNEQAQTILQLIKLGWGEDNPAFRQFFTTLFMPEATAEQMHWFNDLQRHSASPEMAYRLEEAFFHIDVRPLLQQVTTPTLILHAREDAVVPYAEGRQLATLIPGARFVTLESKNHILLENEPAWPRFLDEVQRFIAEGTVVTTPGEERGRDLSPTITSSIYRGNIFTPGTNHTPSPAPGQPRSHNLPPQATNFVGRTQEVDVLRRWLLEAEDYRLLTLLGPGGMGKTRLALAAAQAVLDSFPDGVFFVPLAPLTNPEQIPLALTESLQLHLLSTDEPKQQILAYLRHKQMLLVLDNFEHLLEGATLVADILQTAPGVKVLVTSRERLHLSSERIYTLEGLAYPEWQTLPEAWDETELAAYDALNLLRQRARIMQVTLPLSASEWEAMIRVCHLVQGMPLALLLATSWLPLLSFSEIAAEIEQCLDFLEGEIRDLPERQRSMRATFDSSWRRLKPEEQTVFMKLSVFRGGFTRQAAQAVTGASLRILRTLADKSLLTLARRGREGHSERCEVHELLRQYGAEALEKAGLTETTRQRHNAYYFDLLQRREIDLKGREQRGALQEIEADMENIRQAWHWALLHRALTALSQAVEPLHFFYDMRGRQEEGSLFLHTSCRHLLASGVSETHPVLIRILTRAYFLGLFAAANDHPEVESALRRCLTLTQQQGDPAEIAYCQGALGSYYNQVVFNREKALPLYQEALATYRTLGDPFFISRALQWQSLCYLRQGPISEFYRLARAGLDVARRCGNKVDIVYALINLSEMTLTQGDYETAARDLQEAVQVAEEVEAHVPLVYLEMLHSFLACLEGDMTKAHILIERAYHRAVEISHTIILAFTAGLRTLLCGLAGEYDLARQMGQTSLSVSGNHGLGLIMAHWGLAVVACHEQHDEEARSHLYMALSEAHKNQLTAPLLWLLPVAAVVVAAASQEEQALELLALAYTHPLGKTGWCAHWPLLVSLQRRLQTEQNEATWRHGQSLTPEAITQQFLAAWGT